MDETKSWTYESGTDELDADQIEELKKKSLETIEVRKSGGFNFKTPQGLISEIVDYTLSVAPMKNRLAAISGAIALMSALISRKFVDPTGIHPNLYIVSVSPSGGGKEAPRTTNAKALLAAGAGKLIGKERLVSEGGIMTELRDNPTKLFQIDEFGSMVGTFKSRSRSVGIDVGKFLTELYSKAGSFHSGTAYATNDKGSCGNAIMNPAVVIYGTTTPGQLWDNMSKDDVENGFVNRFLVIPSPMGQINRGVFAELPESLIEQIKAWYEYTTEKGNLADLTHYSEPARLKVVSVSQEADEILHQYRVGIYEKQQSESEVRSNLWQRAAENARKLAMVFAASRCRRPEAFQVEDCDAEAAIELVTMSVREVVDKVYGCIHETRRGMLARKVLEFCTGTGRTKSELTQKFLSNMDKRQRDGLLEDLCEGGVLKKYTTKVEGRRMG